MINKFSSFLLTGASIAPVIAVYAIMFGAGGNYFVATILFAASIALTYFGLVTLRRAKAKVEDLGKLLFKSVENADNFSLGIILIYLVPLLSTSISEMAWLTVIPAVVMFVALSISGQGFHFNPLLNILGWHFYKISTQEGVTFLLITKKSIRQTARLNVGRLTEYTLIDLE